MSSLLAPIYTSLTRLYTALYSRAPKLDNLDATTSSRLSSSDARLANLDATIASRVATADTRLATLDAAISTRAAAADYTSGRAAKLDQLDAAITSRSTLTAAQVWAHSDRDLTQHPSSRMEILTSGSSWTPPAGVTGVKVTVIGAGGGGGGGRDTLSTSGPHKGGAGGRGGLIYRYPLLVSGPVAYQVGAGGAGGAAGVDGTAGGATQFGALIAPGGSGGVGAVTINGTLGASGNASALLAQLTIGVGLYEMLIYNDGTTNYRFMPEIWFGSLAPYSASAVQTPPADGAVGDTTLPGADAAAYGCRGGGGGPNKNTVPYAIGGAGGKGGDGVIILEYIA